VRIRFGCGLDSRIYGTPCSLCCFLYQIFHRSTVKCSYSRNSYIRTDIKVEIVTICQQNLNHAESKQYLRYKNVSKVQKINKFHPLRPMKAYNESGGTAPFILTKLSARWKWVVNIMLRPLLPVTEPSPPTWTCLYGPQSRSGHFRPLPRFELWTIQCVA